MERGANRFAFRASDELGDFIRHMARQTGWSESEVIRFGLGFWMMSVRNGFFATLGVSRYRKVLENINVSSRDVTPLGDIDTMVQLSQRYATASERAEEARTNGSNGTSDDKVAAPTVVQSKTVVELPKSDVKRRKRGDGS